MTSHVLFWSGAISFRIDVDAHARGDSALWAQSPGDATLPLGQLLTCETAVAFLNAKRFNHF